MRIDHLTRRLKLIELRAILVNLQKAPESYNEPELRIQLVKDNISILEGKTPVH